MAHEGTSKAWISRLLLLTTKFKNLNMVDDKTIIEFNVHLWDITNNSFALGKKISDKKPVRKTLRSLSKRFDIKVTSIEENSRRVKE